jgi:hypothetical protein
MLGKASTVSFTKVCFELAWALILVKPGAYTFGHIISIVTTGFSVTGLLSPLKVNELKNTVSDFGP